MARANKRGEAIREFILTHVTDHPTNIAAVTSVKFGITRQAVNKHLQKLCSQNALKSTGRSRAKIYLLAKKELFSRRYTLDGSASEDKVWREDISPLLKGLPENIFEIWHYGFTEMLNNAIDHSMGKSVYVKVMTTPLYTIIDLTDDGEGIFKKIAREMNLGDARHSVLELAKGKLTTDPDNHTGEGIFFTSKVFDNFIIASSDVIFSHQRYDEFDWVFDNAAGMKGTYVSMELANASKSDLMEVFDSFSTGDDKQFSKTIIPVYLAEYGDDKLVSRSQAKRVLLRVEKFKLVLFDFEEVSSIGQAFADEIFRVFQNQNPDIKIEYLNANNQVEGMIIRALRRTG